MATPGRPKKHNCDYFTHDNAMRNDPKLKAVRAKYGIEGYAVYNMILETLTEQNCIVYKWDEMEIEMMAGDFGIESKTLTEMVNYFVKIHLLKITNRYLNCPQLDKRLQYVFDKRNQLLSQIRTENGISVTEIEFPPQKLDEVKGSKVKKNEDIYLAVFDFWNSQGIIKHENFPPPTNGRTTIETATKNLLKAKETVETIQQAILNYKKILESKEHFFSYKWGLVEFLVKGFYKFKDWEIADNNYKRHEFSGNGKPNWANFTPVRGGQTPDGRKIISELKGGYFLLEDKTYLQLKSNRWVNVDGEGKPVSI